MSTTILSTLKSTSVYLVKLALLAALLTALAASLPENLTRINPTAAVQDKDTTEQV